MKNFIPFSKPDIGEEEIAEVIDSLKSGWLTTGPKTRRFERDFADFIGNGVETVAVNSATSGLHLALEAAEIGPEDEVITTPYTFTATSEVIRYLGAHPVFVDIDPETLNIDPAKIEAAITPRTKAILPVHFAGLACEMEAILHIAHKYNLRVVEDAAHALPATYRGKLVGTFDSDAAVYSFYANKTITTGEGGMVVTRNPQIARRCRIMRLHGINQDAFDRYSSTKPNCKYEVVAPGFKYNMMDIAAALGIHQLKKAWGFQQKRADLANMYDDELTGLPLELPAHAKNEDIHAWHLYVIKLRTGKISRDKFISQMLAEGIGCSIHFIPLHLHPYWSKTYQLKPQDFPYASSASEKVVSLPLYPKMTEPEQLRVIEAVKKILS